MWLNRPRHAAPSRAEDFVEVARHIKNGYAALRGKTTCAYVQTVLLSQSASCEGGRSGIHRGAAAGCRWRQFPLSLATSVFLSGSDSGTLHLRARSSVRIEHRTPDPGVEGSNPPGRALLFPHNACLVIATPQNIPVACAVCIHFISRISQRSLAESLCH